MSCFKPFIRFGNVNSPQSVQKKSSPIAGLATPVVGTTIAIIVAVEAVDTEIQAMP